MVILRKIAAVFLVLVISGWIFDRYLLRDFLDDHAEQKLQVEKIKNCDVVYMSASSNFPQYGDDDTRKISQMVASYFPNQRFEAINKPASHAGVFKRLMNSFPENSEVSTFIITINLRSFGADWIYSELESSLNKANLMYSNRPAIINRVLIGLQAYESLTEEERTSLRNEYWDDQTLPVSDALISVNKWCAEYKWGDWKNPKRQLADQFIKQYAIIIQEDNPRIQDLDALVHEAQHSGVNLLFHILSENLEKADSLVGSDLVEIMKDNAQFIEERYSSKGIIVVNNIDLVPSESFTDKDFPTEHYDQRGRQAVASSVAQQLKKL